MMAETRLRFVRLKAFFTLCCIGIPILVTITWLHYTSVSNLLLEFPNFTIINKADPAIAMKAKDQRNSLEPGQKYESLGYTIEDNSSGSTRVDDGESCLSRHESHSYRKSPPHKPSSHLQSKLLHYENLHRSCASSFSFIRNQSNPNSSNNHASSAVNCRYLIWTAMDGLGNRILTLVSAFLYALLTDRVLLVKFESDMDGLFCEPFPNSSWLLPTIRDFSHHHHNWKDDHDDPRAVLHLRHTNDDHYDFFHCSSTQDLLQNVHVLILQSNQYFVPSLFLIPSFRQDLTNMFPEKEKIFHLLGHYLLHPSNAAWKFISNFHQNHLSMATQKIGLQIRVFDTNKQPHQVVLNTILSCTSRNNLLPHPDEKISVTSPSQNHNTSKAVLVISLYSEYGKKLKALYMENTSMRRSNEVIGVFQPSHEENQNSKDNNHNMKAWTEMYLLSLCDVLITSSFSTFGYVAQSLGGLKPWILKGTFSGKVPDPVCERAISIEPCFHFPPKHECSSNTIINVTSFFPHTMQCEDFGNGVKLVT